MGSRKNIRNSKTHITNTLITIKMFFNHPTIFETPMVYQPRPVYYQRRPRTVYRRPQPERSFNFSPFMNELDDIYRFPSTRQQTNETECNCGNCQNGLQENSQQLEPELENETLDYNSLETEK